MAVTFIHPFDNFIIMKKEASILIYDPDFDLVMKEEEDESLSNYKILKVSDKKFILANDQELSLWDLENESKTILNLNEPSIDPSLIELVGGKQLLVAASWIKSYDFCELPLLIFFLIINPSSRRRIGWMHRCGIPRIICP